MYTNLLDGEFGKQDGAIFVTGFFGNAWIDQFAGAGPSSTIFKFKAIQIDGIVFIPDPMESIRRCKRDRDYSHYPMVKARFQPPAKFIVKA